MVASLRREDDAQHDRKSEAKARQLREDERLASSIAEPLFECQACLDDELKIGDMFTLDCRASHRFCFPCARRHVGSELLGASKSAKCPMCDHRVTAQEVGVACVGGGRVGGGREKRARW